MKHFILFLFPLFATTLKAQTEFAPIGAEWAYNSIIDRESVYWDSTKILGLIDVFKSTGDTVINGLTLRKVNNYLFHQSGDSVSVWHAGKTPVRSKFQWANYQVASMFVNSYAATKGW